MTKEQEEAIKYLEKQINYFKEQIKFIEAVDCDYYDEEYKLYKNRVKQFETVLNMLKEKDAEIEKKDKIIDLMSEDWYKEEGYKNRLYEGESEITRYEIKKEILVEQYKKHYERKVENE